MRVERLQELRCAHRFAEGEDAVGMILRFQEIEPFMDVVALQQAVGRELAAAGAMGASVGEEDGESVGEDELRVSGHAEAVVTEAVEEEDGVAVGLVRVNHPRAERDVVGCGDGGVGQIGVEGVGSVADRCDFFFRERAAGGVERAVGEVDAADGA